MRLKLTDLAIRKLPHPERGQATYWDTSTPGFGVRISQRAKAYTVMYGQPRKFKTLGRYPDIPLAEARKEAKLLLATQTAQKTTTSYPAAVDAFLVECKSKNRPKTVKEYTRYLKAYDYVGKVDDILRRDIQKHLNGYAGKSARAHALVAFKIFFNWAIRHELIDRHPLAGERREAAPPRNRVLTSEELRAIYLYDYPPFSTILRLLILTGQRRGEIATLHSDWIEDDTITFPAEITKNKKPHTLPFGDMTAPMLQGEGHLFGNDQGTTYNGWSNAKARIEKHVEIPPWTIHDLRRTFSTIHASLGTPIHVTEKLLNHSSGTISGVAAVYNKHAYLEEMRAAVCTYEKHLAKIVAA